MSYWCRHKVRRGRWSEAAPRALHPCTSAPTARPTRPATCLTSPYSTEWEAAHAGSCPASPRGGGNVSPCAALKFPLGLPKQTHHQKGPGKKGLPRHPQLPNAAPRFLQPAPPTSMGQAGAHFPVKSSRVSSVPPPHGASSSSNSSIPSLPPFPDCLPPSTIRS